MAINLGVRRLVSTPVTPHHETGRQRVVFFYWLGARSSIKDQSRCALALRDYDKERHEHVRVEQGQEPAILLNLFDGKMIVSGMHLSLAKAYFHMNFK